MSTLMGPNYLYTLGILEHPFFYGVSARIHMLKENHKSLWNRSDIYWHCREVAEVDGELQSLRAVPGTWHEMQTVTQLRTSSLPPNTECQVPRDGWGRAAGESSWGYWGGPPSSALRACDHLFCTPYMRFIKESITYRFIESINL